MGSRVEGRPGRPHPGSGSNCSDPPSPQVTSPRAAGGQCPLREDQAGGAMTRLLRQLTEWQTPLGHPQRHSPDATTRLSSGACRHLLSRHIAPPERRAGGRARSQGKWGTPLFEAPLAPWGPWTEWGEGTGPGEWARSSPGVPDLVPPQPGPTLPQQAPASELQVTPWERPGSGPHPRPSFLLHPRGRSHTLPAAPRGPSPDGNIWHVLDTCGSCTDGGRAL